MGINSIFLLARDFGTVSSIVRLSQCLEMGKDQFNIFRSFLSPGIESPVRAAASATDGPH